MKLLKLSFFIMLTAVVLVSCQKEYSIENSNLLTPAGTWQFNDSTKLFTGNMDTAFIETTGSTKILHLEGTSLTGGQLFAMRIYADSILKTGTYRTSLGDVDFFYFTLAGGIYQADQLAGEFVVNITVLANNTVTGTFSGFADDSLFNTKTLTLGQFTSRVDLSSNVIGGGSGVAIGTLGNTAGNCQPTTFSGTYTQGTALTASNTVNVTATVNSLGTYTISTNTVNGVSFSKSGTFTSTGTQIITLAGTGTPAASGAQTYTVTFGTSTCTFPVTYGSAGPPAVGTLGGGPGACTPVTPAGTYTQGVALTASNTVTIQANVTTIGSYSITTSAVNGVTFSGSGNFATTGVQNVVLTGSGTPTASGAQNFTVTFGTSTCNFPITFALAAATDYFPITLNSNWTYGFGSGPLDSLLAKVVSNAVTISGKTYSMITEEYYPLIGIADDSLYFRKPGGGDYYTYLDLRLFGADNTNGNGEYIFLKDNVAVNTTWQSPNFTSTFGGTSAVVYIVGTIKAKAVPALGFPDVIKVSYEYFANGLSQFTEERWYAKGVGLIYYTDSTFTQTIGRFQVF